MRCYRYWVVVGLLAGLLPLAATARPVAGAPTPVGGAASIEQALLDRLAAQGKANFFVKMAVEADLSDAYAISDWTDRGTYVYRTLQDVSRASQAPIITHAEGLGLENHSFLANNSVYVRGGSLEAARSLAELPGVAFLRMERTVSIPEADRMSRPTGAPEAIMSWGILDTGAYDAWQLGARGAGIRVANIDTGVQWDHPALIDQYGCPDDPGDPACWYDPSNICGGQPCDNVDHGTHTIGTMVAKDDPALPYIAGLAPDATWIACKGCETGSCSEFALTACADWVLAPGDDPANRPHVVNNSWWLGDSCEDWYQPHLAAWLAAGIFPAFADADVGPWCGSMGSPGDYQESFCSTTHDSNRDHAGFAGLGPSCFGDEPYTKPNISAPGVDICSTVPGDGWDCWSGTTTSSPHSGGAAALVLSACPDYVGQVGATVELLQDNADTPPDGFCGAPPDGEGNYTYGYGYLNVLAAVEACAAETVHVDGIKMRWRDLGGGRYALQAAVRILDEEGVPAGGAVVDVTWTLPSGASRSQQRPTNPAGVARFGVQSRQTGPYEVCVTSVNLDGYLYDPNQNGETCDTIVVP